MSHHPLAPFYAALERRFGRIAFPNLVRILAIFQFGVLILAVMQPAYLDQLYFDRARIMGGEVWRLFSFLFVPYAGTGASPATAVIFGAIFMMFMWMMGDGLERAWGSFGVNLYILGTWLCFVLAGFIMPAQGFFSFALFSSLLFAFAALYPDHTILAMLVIPVKIKWLALVDLAFVLLVVVDAHIFGLILVTLCFTPWLVAFLPGLLFWMKNRKKVTERRNRFENQKLPEAEAFHHCARCGATENSEPDLQFMVEDDGEEYCERCLKVMEGENAS